MSRPLALAIAVVAGGAAFLGVFASNGASSGQGPPGCGVTGPTGSPGVGTTGQYGTTGAVGPHGQAGPWGAIAVDFNCSGGRPDSVDVTVSDDGIGGIQLAVHHRRAVVYQAHYSGSDFSPPEQPGTSSSPGWTRHTWFGTLSPGDWDGGCQGGSYWIDVYFDRRLYTEDVSSPNFTCGKDVPSS